MDVADRARRISPDLHDLQVVCSVLIAAALALIALTLAGASLHVARNASAWAAPDRPPGLTTGVVLRDPARTPDPDAGYSPRRPPRTPASAVPVAWRGPDGTSHVNWLTVPAGPGHQVDLVVDRHTGTARPAPPAARPRVPRPPAALWHAVAFLLAGAAVFVGGWAAASLLAAGGLVPSGPDRRTRR